MARSVPSSSSTRGTAGSASYFDHSVSSKSFRGSRFTSNDDTPTYPSRGSSRSASHLGSHDSPHGSMPTFTDPRASPNSGALATSFTSSTHGKLHKRTGSGSNTPNSSPALSSRHASSTKVKYSSALKYGRETSSAASTSPVPKQKTKTKIKPLLKKLAPEETKSLDLSRSTVENEGLGIYTNLERDKRHDDPNAHMNDQRGGFHHRSTSGTSQFSSTTISSLNKPGSQYIHPMRQTPRPYTPPLSQSYQNSVVGSEVSGDGSRVPSDIDYPQRPTARDQSREASRIRSTHTPQSTLRIHTSSLTKFPSLSQTNVSGTPTSLRGNGDTMSAVDTMSPLSRSSLDKGFRTRSRTNTDPATRAANIEAARQAFEEREAAKSRKLEKQQMKVQDRDMRKRDKKEQNVLAKTEKMRQSRETSGDEKAGSLGGPGYENLPKLRTPNTASTSNKPSRTGNSAKTPRSTWVLFLTWFRTKFFKLGRKVKNTN